MVDAKQGRTVLSMRKEEFFFGSKKRETERGNYMGMIWELARSEN